VTSTRTLLETIGANGEVTVDSKPKFATKADASHDSLLFAPTHDQIEQVNAATRSISPKKISPREQTLTGLVSAIQCGPVTSFTLTVSRDSYFTEVTGLRAITVFQVSGTQLRHAVLTNGAVVEIKGLLFVDGNEVKMVAKRISSPKID
jgi:hypothetical protein